MSDIAPDYVLGKVSFKRTVIDGQRYEWVSLPNGRIRAGRRSGCGEYWATIDGRPVLGQHLTLRSAMLSAVQIGSQRRAA